MIGAFELISAVAGMAGSAFLTIYGQQQKDRYEIERARLEKYEKVEDSTRAAREYEPKWKGFYWIRGAIALMAAFYVFLLPMLTLFTPGLQVVVGYYDITQGFLPWTQGPEAVHWIKVGAQDPTSILVQTPAVMVLCTGIMGL